MTAADAPLLQFEFEADVIHWRGPSPFFFAPLPPPCAAEVRRVSRAVTYLLPLKDAVRRKAGVTAGDKVGVEMTVRPPRR